MKIIKLSSGKELTVRDSTPYATTIHTSPESAAEAEQLIDELTDEELTHVELLTKNGTVLDSVDNLTFLQMGLDVTKTGRIATYLLVEKTGGVPADIQDKADGYDILTGGV